MLYQVLILKTAGSRRTASLTLHSQLHQAFKRYPFVLSAIHLKEFSVVFRKVPVRRVGVGKGHKSFLREMNGLFSAGKSLHFNAQHCVLLQCTSYINDCVFTLVWMLEKQINNCWQMPLIKKLHWSDLRAGNVDLSRWFHHPLPHYFWRFDGMPIGRVVVGGGSCWNSFLVYNYL